MSRLLGILLLCIPGFVAYGQPVAESQDSGVTLIVLGTVQDGGSPHIGCSRSCCAPLQKKPDPGRMVVSLGVADARSGKHYLFEATPDIPRQLRDLGDPGMQAPGAVPDGIFLTHAHIGHYTGLMFLGKEALGARQVPVFAMPRMAAFLEENGPWGQLVASGNIRLEPLREGEAVTLGESLEVTPLRVPHRDEYSETVGFLIRGPRQKVLFIPDIDKWERWDTPIEELLSEVDLAFVDATFYDAAEIGYRDISQIPHPFVSESRKRWDKLPAETRAKVYFIHLNHTNPLLDPESAASRATRAAGYRIARRGQKFQL